MLALSGVLVGPALIAAGALISYGIFKSSSKNLFDVFEAIICATTILTHAEKKPNEISKEEKSLAIEFLKICDKTNPNVQEKAEELQNLVKTNKSTHYRWANKLIKMIKKNKSQNIFTEIYDFVKNEQYDDEKIKGTIYATAFEYLLKDDKSRVNKTLEYTLEELINLVEYYEEYEEYEKWGEYEDILKIAYKIAEYLSLLN